MMFIPRFSTFIFTATCLSVAACSNNDNNTVDNSILFKPCEATAILDCGQFEVPLIHGSTDNRRISIDVARLPGTGSGPKEPLLLNIGGPGSGVEMLRELANFGGLPASIRERYDIIGFDQRGVSKPLRVDCDSLGNAESLPYPRDQNEVQALINDATMLADACSAEYSDSLQWIGSNAVVQDMEVMRSMLNAPKLNIFAASFGTRITSLYLQRYPETSGRIVLDAPLRPNGKIDPLLLDTVTAQQYSFELMLDACGTTLPDCDRTTAETLFVSRINNLIDNEDLTTFEAFFLLITIAVEETDNGEFLAPLLIDYAINGDPTDMFALIEEFGLDEEEERENGGSDDEENVSITLERAVLCADDDARQDVAALITTLDNLNQASDFFAEALLPLAASCFGWPEALDPMMNIQTADAPASLVIGGSMDTLTPISWAVETATAIGGVFLSSDHLGHTVAFHREDQCVDSIVIEFLIDGKLPPEGTVCD